MTIEDSRFSFTDFEPEPGMTGDGSGDPDKYFLTITEYGEEMSHIIHRTEGGRFPLDGAVARSKRQNARRIVDALRTVYNEF